MRVRLLFFARARELAGVGETEVEVASHATAAVVLKQVLETWPALEEVSGRCVLAVNQEYLEDMARILKEGDEVAVLPPVSGG
ncbi:hypothetical protein WJX74_005787 [Apatococcus lobatus]|uniref:Molybdopterin synthase sulfur carrier subunit n=1 Tax=Apatococcus lobatus TaxID=904363 RepID=A0AAW1RKU1_9CHLO